ncbi:alpha/beta hydrolase fold protein [Pseudodesulfovibrio mercurii]|uniref:Alpha/beta hydrolase fold protein n=1 Tax=Pseudodesulfovibrio mercurii TaxID=641491 RepID=F0JKW4_9BACT|nr:alpha/beta hydrolase [Pseudodesulfovibrio mercurii]EGB16563.1 alpha/beta hydrolase fold protein [Pseudodesulfovibrio mercurii]
MSRARANGIDIEYDTFGDGKDPALLLIMGGGSQMIYWEAGFCEMLAGRGYHVIRFDNRDIGLSTTFDEAGVPDMAAVMAGEPVTPAYTLEDMADDAAGLLDALGIDRAHVCGASVGGMIAQAVAYRHPARVLSLTCIMSSTGNPDLPKIADDVLAEVYKPVPAERGAFVAHQVAMWRKLWSPGFPFEEERLRRLLGEGFDRSYHPQGMARQGLAVVAHGYRPSAIASIEAPTLVIHGDRDPFMSLEGGRETARLIPGARLLVIEGMGHDLPTPVWPRIVEAMAEHMGAADRQQSPAQE